MGGDGREFSWVGDRGGRVCALHDRAAGAFTGDGGGGECGGAGWRSIGIGLQAERGDQGFGEYFAGAWRGAGPD